MARALDHLVLATRDLSRMAALFAALGFQVGGRNRHPWGTENHIIQFRSSFLELIGLGAGHREIVQSDPAYPFAGFIERYLAVDPSGIAMAVLRSDDAAADAAEFERAGLGTGRMLPFSRSARGPDGSDRTVAFTIAFTEPADMPSAGFFTCQQHRPENFWNTAFQQHANGAIELAGFSLLTHDVAGSAQFLSAFADRFASATRERGCEIPLEGGRIRIMTLADFAAFAPEYPAAPSGPTQIVAMLLVVRSLAEIRAKLDRIRGSWTAAPTTGGQALALWPSEEPTFTIICKEGETV